MWGNIFWGAGLAGAIAYFGIGEYFAYTQPDWNTLSHDISSIAAAWPPSMVIMGFFMGGLTSHFFWPWNYNPLNNKTDDPK